MPVFHEANWSASSPIPRTMSTSARRRPASSSTFPDVFAEGMLLNGLKLYNEGAQRAAVEVHPRHPRAGLVMGDPEAQIASAELGVLRFQELMATYGKDTVLQAT